MNPLLSVICLLMCVTSFAQRTEEYAIIESHTKGKLQTINIVIGPDSNSTILRNLPKRFEGTLDYSEILKIMGSVNSLGYELQSSSISYPVEGNYTHIPHHYWIFVKKVTP